MKKISSVDGYIDSKPQWTEALLMLREILAASQLEECIKWGMPTYCLGNKNVLGFSAFKSYVGIWFFKGVFLEDKAGKLVNAQEGVTKAQRQWRFTDAGEIRESKSLIREYLAEAIQNQKDGKEIKADRNKPIDIPDELRKAFQNDPLLLTSFDTLSPSKRREHAEHIAGAKREETRIRRLHKAIPLIKEGRGLHDQYK